MTLEEYLQSKGTSLEELKNDADALATHFNEFNKIGRKALDEAIEGKASKEDISQLRLELTENYTKQFETLRTALKEQGVALSRVLAVNVKDDSPLTFDQQIKNALENEDNKAILEEAAKGTKDKTVKIKVTKAATDPLLQGDGLGTVIGDVPQPFRKPDFVDQRRRPSFIRNWITNGSMINGATIEWVEQQNIEETTGGTAEGDLKNDMHWQYVVKSEGAKTRTVTTVVSTKALRRIDMMRARINTQLMRSLDNDRDQQILFGDGLNENFNGIFTQGSAFAAGVFAGTIDNANNYDVIRVAINQCNTGSSGTINAVGEPAGFFPTVVAVNPTAMAQMDLSKGSDGHYVMPPFSSADGTVIKGVRVIGSNHLGADQFLVMEGPLVEYWEEQEMFIEIGVVDDQLKRNMRTIVAEYSALIVIPDNYVNGIVIGDFTSAKAALETP